MSGPEIDLAALRREYQAAHLDEAEAASDPWEQFRRWLVEAVESPLLPEPNAMVLATASLSGVPSARTVLLKEVRADVGFVFYTHTASPKGRDLAENPACALLFEWSAMQRQVRVCGSAQALSRADVEAYFATRPRAAQVGAWASEQSAPVAGRDALTAGYDEAARRFGGEAVDAVQGPPPTWGGYLVRPESFEFWQGRESRMHDRLEYRQQADSPLSSRQGSGQASGQARWIRRRLAP